MEANKSKSKQKKLAKKTERKKEKSQKLLRKQGNVKIAMFPTKNLLVTNGGLGNGVSREDILNLFRPFGLLEAVTMTEQMPHCFVTFSNVEFARKALEALNGHSLTRGAATNCQTVTLYLSYVDSVPDVKSKPSKCIEGLFLLSDFINEELEEKLQELVQWDSADNRGSLKHRKVKHFGYEFNYDTNNVDVDRPLQEPMPEILMEVIDKIMQTGHVTHRPDQVTVNQYLPGQGIPPHVDTHSAFQDAIVSLSLGSAVSMEFSHPDGSHLAKVLPPRSLLVMTGEARYLWSHGITPRKHDVVAEVPGDDAMTLSTRGIRTSFTFRAVRGKPCCCEFPSRCDSQRDIPEQSSSFKSSNSELSKPAVKRPTSELEAIKLEHCQVHEVYNKIAPHFSYTRYKPWPLVSDFLNSLEDGSLVLDVGCGNGKYIGVNPRLFMVGCDRSEELISICGQRGHEVMVCDGLTVNMKSNLFDACISIAVIHHFSTETRRLEAIQELVRLLRPGGQALIYVWAMEQKKQDKRSIYLMKKKDHQSAAGKNSAEGTIPPVVSSNPESITKSESEVRNALGRIGGEAGVCLSEQMHRMNLSSEPVGVTGDDRLVEPCCEYSSDVKGEHIQVRSSSENFAENSQCVPDLTESIDGNSDNYSRNLTVHVNKTEFKDQDLLVPWHLRNTGVSDASVGKQTSVFYRFYHVFQEGELEKLISKLDQVSVTKSYYDQGNWCAVIKKDEER